MEYNTCNWAGQEVKKKTRLDAGFQLQHKIKKYII